MIIPVWKKIGQSTHLLAQKVGKKTAQKTTNLDDAKATHTGTLDPMAEGIVVVLTGEDRFKKADFSNWKKTYEFEIMFGVSTDSLDLLGLNAEVIDQEKIENLHKKDLDQLTKKIIPKFIGQQKQTQPKFSAQRIDGKSAFDLAKDKTTTNKIELKENKIEIFSLEILDQKNVPAAKLKTEILKNLSHISGDFRQKEIIENWQETFSKLEILGIKTIPIFKLRAEVSKRTYIRALVRDIAKQLEIPGTTYSIVRTKNGEYTLDNCYNKTHK